MTGQIKNLVYGFSTLKETSEFNLYNDAYLPDPMINLLYGKPERLGEEDVKKMEEHLNRRVAIISYFDVDEDIPRHIVTCYPVYVLNENGKTIEKII